MEVCLVWNLGALMSSYVAAWRWPLCVLAVVPGGFQESSDCTLKHGFIWCLQRDVADIET